jgi:hypothetical protein
MPTTRLEVPGAMPNDAAQEDPTLKSRSRRFPIQTLLRYRQSGTTEWNETTTVNISRSGVLFETVEKLPVDTFLEMQILFPARTTRGVPSNVLCRGPVIRTEPSQAAAAIHHYRLRRTTA